MNQISAIARARIEAQGFVGLDDRTLAQIDDWLRLSPAICMLWAAVGTALSSPTVLWSLVPFAALGALRTGHPFDVLYNYGFRYVVHGPRLPRYPLPRRFACLLATAVLAGAAWVFSPDRLWWDTSSAGRLWRQLSRMSALVFACLLSSMRWFLGNRRRAP